MIFELVLDPNSGFILQKLVRSVFAAVCVNTVYTYSGKNTVEEPLWYENLMDKAECPYKRYVRLIKFSTV